MRAFAMALVLTLIASAAVAQQPAAQTPDQTPKTFTTSADVQALLAKAKSDHKEGQTNVLEPILVLAPYRANLEYRTGVGPGAVHEREAELMYVIDGSGTIVIGGKLVEEKRTNAENLAGTSIEGGTAATTKRRLVRASYWRWWVCSLIGMVCTSLPVRVSKTTIF